MPLNPWGWGALSTVVFCKQFSSCVAIGGLIPPFSSISSCNRQEISSTAHKQACGPLLKHVKLESKLLCLTKKQFFSRTCSEVLTVLAVCTFVSEYHEYQDSAILVSLSISLNEHTN
jgi:hypothetical protein